MTAEPIAEHLVRILMDPRKSGPMISVAGTALKVLYNCEQACLSQLLHKRRFRIRHGAKIVALSQVTKVYNIANRGSELFMHHIDTRLVLVAEHASMFLYIMAASCRE